MNHKEYEDLQKKYKLGNKILLGIVIFSFLLVIFILVKFNK